MIPASRIVEKQSDTCYKSHVTPIDSVLLLPSTAGNETSVKARIFSVEPNGRIPFGAGPENKFGEGPNIKLCDLYWALVRVMRMREKKGSAPQLQKKTYPYSQTWDLNPNLFEPEHLAA
ncbi:hypothetical protein ARMGADRAFT_1036424 [Armillaria gallica]|uniref:Uncharacterized protein n=1 Tax=Armillaria gallica TaxID=47427 RepID=A0A2H3D3N3_ARMGA|nr:hypothetical protein ARMGADRAFT_1036424 [Armillaria gallica]